MEFCEQHNCTVETAAGVGLPNCDLCKVCGKRCICLSVCYVIRMYRNIKLLAICI